MNYPPQAVWRPGGYNNAPYHIVDNQYANQEKVVVGWRLRPICYPILLVCGLGVAFFVVFVILMLSIPETTTTMVPLRIVPGQGQPLAERPQVPIPVPAPSPFMMQRPPAGPPPPAGLKPPPAGPPPPAQSQPFDCMADFASWQTAWPVDKKAWCCQNAGKGCAPGPRQPPAQQPQFDCSADDHGQGQWSEPQKTWCCKAMGKGCPASPLPPPGSHDPPPPPESHHDG